jgi:hypothetical protein
VSALEDLKARQDQAVEDGFCACLCGRRLPSKLRGRRHLDEHHRNAAYDARVVARAADQGVQATSRRISVSRLGGSSHTGTHRADASDARKAPARRRPPELRISFAKAVGVLADWLAYRGDDEATARKTAETLLSLVLTDRQRVELARRRAREGASA